MGVLTGGGLLDQNLGGLVAGATDVEAGSEVAAVHAYALQVVVNSLGVTGGLVDGDVLDAGVAALELVQGDTLRGSDGNEAYTLVVGLELVDVSLDIGVTGCRPVAFAQTGGGIGALVDGFGGIGDVENAGRDIVPGSGGCSS